MKPTTFDLIRSHWESGKFVCVGLDPMFEYIPQRIRKSFAKVSGNRQVGMYLSFITEIVKVTHDLVCAYKVNPAFWESAGPEGAQAVYTIIQTIHEQVSDVPVILDAKRADCPHTMEAYKVADFVGRGADAITVNPYLGREAVQPYLDEEDRATFVLCRTSNDGAQEIQHLRNGNNGALYCTVARKVGAEWNEHGNCGLVVGATSLIVLENVRQMVPDMPILVPGLGAQGGDAKEIVRAGKGAHDFGLILSASRSIIGASDPRKEVLRLIEEAKKGLKPKRERKKKHTRKKKTKS